jgi:methylenetetrahydrofolate--tRNA-(uracil-5-)-methyltransferase
VADLVVIGAGLAGCEAAWQAAVRGLNVDLYEMRPLVATGAHTGDQLAELVCSNSLGSNQLDRASGLMKQELRGMGSLLVSCADKTALPAGGALAVDRVEFSRVVTRAIADHPRIRLIRQEVTSIPDELTVIASGPLTSDPLVRAMRTLTGSQQLYFYDALAPIVSAESIDADVAYRGSRYGHGECEEGDYINCPLSRQEYDAFVDLLVTAQRMELREFELDIDDGVDAGAAEYFEGCLPVEALARRGREALAYGPLRPVGLILCRCPVAPGQPGWDAL